MSAEASSAERTACDSPEFQTLLHASPAGAETPPARAYWLDARTIQWPAVSADGVFKLYHAAAAGMVAMAGEAVTGADGAFALVPRESGAMTVPARFRHVAAGVTLAVSAVERRSLTSLHKSQLLLVQEDSAGKVRRVTRVQSAGALDDLYSAAAALGDLGVTIKSGKTGFRLWAPTAQMVSLCLYPGGNRSAGRIEAMQWDDAAGTWRVTADGDLSGAYYAFLVDVYVPGAGIVRNRVTDPYSLSLTADSRRSYVVDLDARQVKPAGWDKETPPRRVRVQTDLVIYELHVRDFSLNDPSVPPRHRGKYLAFTDMRSAGMRHLRALSRAGLTDIHLLPVFDFATVPEVGCANPDLGHADRAPDSEEPQSIVSAVRERDCFNWGYDPLHYTAPEGSYATDPADGARRIVEFRQMVAALHRLGLRVGMDVVYNHTSASGQHRHSVLDRIVPGYYHRLNAEGMVERSTCCDNTATENLMMGKLMIDSVLTWARAYKIDSFRFDLMGHQPRAVMEKLKAALTAETGRDIHLIGEGWNFGEVADGARFVQASQLSLNGSGIGTFSDRARDAVRGGGPADSGPALVERQGYINGLHYDANAANRGSDKRAELLRAADLVRVGLAGSLRDYPLMTHAGRVVPLRDIDYNGQSAGYVSEPGEVVNYVENHDNQTLFDINVLKLPLATSAADRARVQILGLATTAFSQGVAYFHAGSDILRSKSLDRNSFDSGDWFNRIDWSCRQNYFGMGLPPKADNGADYGLIRPLLANAAIRPAPLDIAWTRDAFRDLLKIRASTTLFRMGTARDVASRLHFFNVGPSQVPTVLAAHLQGEGYAGARFRDLVYLINVDTVPQSVNLAQALGTHYSLHPVQAAAAAADQRVRHDAAFDTRTGTFRVPPRSAAVFVRN